MCEKSETAGGEPAACHCGKSCTACKCHPTEKPTKQQGYSESIAAAIQRYTERERRRKPQIVHHPLRRGKRGRR